MTTATAAQIDRKLDSMTAIMQQMCNFASDRRLAGNPDVNFSIQRWFTSAMNLTYKLCNGDMDKTYRNFREIAAEKAICPIWNRHATLKQKVKCAHWFIPQNGGGIILDYSNIF